MKEPLHELKLMINSKRWELQEIQAKMEIVNSQKENCRENESSLTFENLYKGSVKSICEQTSELQHMLDRRKSMAANTHHI